MNSRNEILAQMEQIGREQDRQLPPLTADLPLADSGLDSLCFAILVARLDVVLGVDPFTENEDAPFPVTLGEFISFYENASR